MIQEDAQLPIGWWRKVGEPIQPVSLLLSNPNPMQEVKNHPPHSAWPGAWAKTDLPICSRDRCTSCCLCLLLTSKLSRADSIALVKEPRKVEGIGKSNQFRHLKYSQILIRQQLRATLKSQPHCVLSWRRSKLPGKARAKVRWRKVSLIGGLRQVKRLVEAGLDESACAL